MRRNQTQDTGQIWPDREQP